MKDRLRYKNEGNQWSGITYYTEFKCDCGEWIRIYEECEGLKKRYSYCPKCGIPIPWDDIPFEDEHN